MNPTPNTCVVIPTMRRRNGFKYLEDSLANNAPQLSDPKIFTDKFLLFDETDEPGLSALIRTHDLQVLHRKRHPELEGLDARSYDYWRIHLCLDFAYSMTRAQNESNSDYFVWLEDDTFLSPKFGHELHCYLANHRDFKVVSANHTEAYRGGFACMIFERAALTEYVSLVKERCQENIPLDWMYQYLDYKIQVFPKKRAFHRGQFSSQVDGDFERIVEYENFFQRLGYRLAVKLGLIARPK